MYIGSPDTPSLGMASSKVSPNHSSVQKSRQSNVVPLQRQGLGPNSLVPGGQGEHGCWGDIGMLRVPDSSQKECSDLGGCSTEAPQHCLSFSRTPRRRSWSAMYIWLCALHPEFYLCQQRPCRGPQCQQEPRGGCCVQQYQEAHGWALSSLQNLLPVYLCSGIGGLEGFRQGSPHLHSSRTI